MSRLSGISSVTSTAEQQPSQQLRLILNRRPVAPRSMTAALSSQSGGWFQPLFDGMKAPPELEEKDDPEARARNLRRLDDLFESQRRSMFDAQKAMRADFDKLSAREQEAALTWFEQLNVFFNDVINWLRETTFRVLNAIREGWRLVKEKVGELFKQAMDAILQLFSAM